MGTRLQPSCVLVYTKRIAMVSSVAGSLSCLHVQSTYCMCSRFCFMNKYMQLVYSVQCTPSDWEYKLGIWKSYDCSTPPFP